MNLYKDDCNKIEKNKVAYFYSYRFVSHIWFGTKEEPLILFVSGPGPRRKVRKYIPHPPPECVKTCLGFAHTLADWVLIFGMGIALHFYVSIYIYVVLAWLGPMWWLRGIAATCGIRWVSSMSNKAIERLGEWYKTCHSHNSKLDFLLSSCFGLFYLGLEALLSIFSLFFSSYFVFVVGSI